MPLERGQWEVGGVLVEAEPAEWPRSPFETLELRVTRGTGWRHLGAAALAALNAQYKGAHGAVSEGIKGLVVQYVEGTGGPAVQVADWRGNSGAFAWYPDNGLEARELHGTAEDPGGPYYEATLRLAPMFP